MLSIIVAIDKNGLIGCNNSLLWNIPNDLKRFKEITINHTVIVGRKTFESLPFVLPKRNHIIITKNKDYKFQHQMVQISHDLDKTIAKYKNSDENAFIIGGGEIYSKSIEFAHMLYITYIEKEYEGDTFFPTIDTTVFKKIWTSQSMYSQEERCEYKFVNYINSNILDT